MSSIFTRRLSTASHIIALSLGGLLLCSCEGDDVEDAVDDTADAVEDAADEVEDTIDDIGD